MRRPPSFAVLPLALIAACGTPSAPLESPRVSASTAPASTVPAITLPDGRIAVTSVVVAARSTCALLVDGSVWCWGGFYQKLRNTMSVHEVAPLPKVKALAAGGGRTYALTEAGDVFEWGVDASAGDITSPRKLDVQGVRRITVGGAHVCFLFERGNPLCRHAVLGEPRAVPVDAVAVVERDGEVCVATPTVVSCDGEAPLERRIADVVELAASERWTCARTRLGRVTCWSQRASSAVDPFAARTFTALESNDHGVCARALRGPPVCLEDVPRSQEETGFASFADTMQHKREIGSVSLGPSGACFVEGGYVWCWGDADEVGYDPEPTRIDLGDLTSLRSARQVAVAVEHTCVLGMDDVVRCWGANTAGALGVGDEAFRLGPERWAPGPPIEKIATREYSTCALTKASATEEGGRVLCAGAFSSALGAMSCAPGADLPCAKAPALVTSGAKDVVVGSDYACALLADGGVQCWGENALGQLGAGDLTSSATARPVLDAAGAPLANVKKVFAMPQHACALVGQADGGTALACWGYDDPGVQGRAIEPGVARPNTGALRLYATPVPMPGPVVDVGERCVVLEGGEARCWGSLPNGDFAILPTRVGVCGATGTRGGCVLGPTGATCVADPPPGAASPPPYAGPPILSWALDATSSCVVDAEHRVACRWRWEGVPYVGGGGPAVSPLGFAPAAAGAPPCPADPPTGARPPVTLWRSAYVVAPSGGVRKLGEDDVKILADVMATPVDASCKGDEVNLFFRFEDASGRLQLILQYVGAPCEGLLDRGAGEKAFHRLGPAGKKLVKSILAALGSDPRQYRE